MFRVPCDRVNSLSWVRSSRAPVSCDAPRLTARKRSTAQAASAIQPPFRLSNPRIIGTPSNGLAPLDGDGGQEQEQCDHRSEIDDVAQIDDALRDVRSEEHTSELQSLMRISYAVFCLKKKNTTKYSTTAAE